MDEKCIVNGCDNNNRDGEFIGRICAPCYKYLTTGKVGPTTSFLKVLSKIKNSCPKCGETDIHTKYHKNAYDCLYSERADKGINREHLHIFCRNCQYSWTRSILGEKDE